MSDDNYANVNQIKQEQITTSKLRNSSRAIKTHNGNNK